MFPMKLGLKVKPRVNAAVQMKEVVQAKDLPEAPKVWRAGVDNVKLRMHNNDKYGICALACKGHHITSVNHQAGKPGVYADDTDMLRAYWNITGNRDSGMTLEQSLDWMVKYGLSGRKIVAYAQLPATDIDYCKRVMYAFGGTTGGLLMPSAWQSFTDPLLNKLWDVGRGGAFQPGTWGGHAIGYHGYDDVSVLCGTWGNFQRISWKAIQAYGEIGGLGMYVMLDPAYVVDGKTVSGVEVQGLIEAFDAINGSDPAPIWPYPIPTTTLPPTPTPIPPVGPLNIHGTLTVDSYGNVTGFSPSMREVASTAKSLDATIVEKINVLIGAIDGDTEQLRERADAFRQRPGILTAARLHAAVKCTLRTGTDSRVGATDWFRLAELILELLEKFFR